MTRGQRCQHEMWDMSPFWQPELRREVSSDIRGGDQRSNLAKTCTMVWRESAVEALKTGGFRAFRITLGRSDPQKLHKAAAREQFGSKNWWKLKGSGHFCDNQIFFAASALVSQHPLKNRQGMVRHFVILTPCAWSTGGLGLAEKLFLGIATSILLKEISHQIEDGRRSPLASPSVSPLVR